MTLDVCKNTRRGNFNKNTAQVKAFWLMEKTGNDAETLWSFQYYDVHLDFFPGNKYSGTAESPFMYSRSPTNYDYDWYDMLWRKKWFAIFLVSVVTCVLNANGRCVFVYTVSSGYRNMNAIHMGIESPPHCVGTQEALPKWRAKRREFTL